MRNRSLIGLLNENTGASLARAAALVLLLALASPAGVFGSAKDNRRCDINADGYDDLFVGAAALADNLLTGELAAYDRDYGEDLDGVEAKGLVHLIKGSPAGLDTPLDSPSETLLPGSRAFHFGSNIACADFDGNGFDDVAIWNRDASRFGGQSYQIQVFYHFEDGRGSSPAIDPRAFPFDVPGVYGAAMTTGDYNGDGYDDLVVSSPRGAIEYDLGGLFGSSTSGSFVHILFGGPLRLPTRESEGLWQTWPPTDEPSRSLGYGLSLATGDFDGDGYDDVAIGDPKASWYGFEIYEHGAIEVIFGSSDGFSEERPGDVRRRYIDQTRSAILDEIEPHDYFGRRLVAADLDNDGNDDLVIGLPFENVGGVWGAVQVLPGRRGTGFDLNEPGEDFILQETTPGIAGDEGGAWLGEALAAGDFDGDGFEDLAIGVPGEDGEQGGVVTFYGSSSWGEVVQSEHFQPVGGQAGEGAGAHLTSGDYDGDGVDDVMVSVPCFSVYGSVSCAGGVFELYGERDRGLTTERSLWWYQDLPNIEGLSEENDFFGGAVR